MTREEVLQALRAHPGEYVSGGELAERLKISRTAVWKAVEQLRAEGYPIDSVPRRGHCLRETHDVLSEERIREYLSEKELRVKVYPTITSTNTVLKRMAAEEELEGLALVAGEQTAGRGRMGRSFFSPAGSGLYLSLLLRPKLEVAEATRLTACAAVATAEALEEISGERLGIKWVNDLFLRGRKVCGILTEAGLEGETGRMSYVIIGIGINLRPPEGDFPGELREIAGALFEDQGIPELRNRLAAGILDRLWVYARKPSDPEIFEKYRERSLALGKPIQVLSPGGEALPAQALELSPDYALRVRMADGTERLLRSGEISIRLEEHETIGG